MTLTQINKAGLDEIALDHVFTIGASGTDHYTFQGEGLNGTVNDPTLYLTRGKTYRFENGTGAHAIRIQSADDGTSGTLYNTGVTNNNTTGTVIVEVQHDAPDVLYYQCASHANMKGTIYVTGALADGGVTTAKIADDAVTTAKIADDAITTAKIASGAVHTAELVNSSVTTAKIVDGSVTTDKLAADAVTNAKIADGAVDSEHLAAGILNNSNLFSGAIVNTAQIVNNAVTTNEIANDAVTSAKIADEAVGLHKLPHGTAHNDGKFLRANNGADPTFETVTGTTINNNANNRVITGSDTANTLEGEGSLTWDGTDFLATGSSGVPQLTIENTSNSAREASLNVKGKHSNGTVRQLMLKYDSADTFRIHTGGSVPLIFETADAERMRITGNGKVGIGMTNPDDTLDVNGTFQVSSNSYMSNLYMSGSLFIGGTGSANEIDDYEEGNWTPLVTFGGGASSQGYDYQVGRYIKIGKLVHCTCYVNFNDKGSSTGTAKLTGLPFTTRNQNAFYGVAEFGYWNGGSSSAGPGSISDFIGYAETNNTQIQIQRQEMNNSVPAVNDATNDHFADSTDFMMAITYIAE